MKNFKYILVMLLAFTISTSCDDDDEIKLTQEELLVQYSPWDYVGMELLNIVNTGNPDFVKEEWEDEMDSEQNDFTYNFRADGTMTVTSINPPNPDKVDLWNWEIINGNQIKFYMDGNEIIYDNLKVTEADFECTYKDVKLVSNVTADVVILFKN